MASTIILGAEQARALLEAQKTIEGLLGEQSPRIYSAQNDVVGRTMPEYVSAMTLAELVRVVAAQQERIEQLESAAKPKAGGATKK